MSDRPYDDVGREPMDDEALVAAVEAYRADHPDADDALLGAVERRLRRLNTQAHARASERARIHRIIEQAADDGIALPWGAAVAALRERDEAARRDSEARTHRQAEQYAAQEVKRPRPAGRPKGSRTVGRDQIVDTFRSLRTKLKRNPTQDELAQNLDPRIATRTLHDLLNEYRLPWPIE